MNKANKLESRPVAGKIKKPETRPVASKAKQPEPRQVVGKTKKSEPHPFSLRAVYLREGKQWIKDDFDPLLPGQPLFGQIKVGGHRIQIQEAVENVPDAKVIKSCRITMNFGFRYLSTKAENPKDEEDGEYMVAEISAQITADYLLKSSKTPPKEKLEQWAKSNSLLHCWPYWREFCHSTLSRMSLPITMMPMVELDKK